MSRTFRVIQLNVRKQGEVHDSLMNDEEIRGATVVAIQEPHARMIQGQASDDSDGPPQMDQDGPINIAQKGDGRSGACSGSTKRWKRSRSRWTRPDMTAAIIRLPDTMVLVISVYVPGVDATALKEACENIREDGDESETKDRGTGGTEW